MNKKKSINSILFLNFSVESVTSKEQVRAKPIALNTVELMRAASSGLGIGPHTVMQIAEK
jgi:DNA topoisomerase III